jgi:RHS repeat-associated protein
VKKFTMDAFGNLTQVTEDPSGLDYVSTYSYDLLNHLTGVSMTRSTGTQTRSFSYTGNQLTSATNPENGTVRYTYNSTNHKVATRIDAKGQEVDYSYDSLARLSEVQRYPTSGTEDTCQREVYYYDGSNPTSSTYPQYATGRLSAVQYWGAYNPDALPTCDTTFTEMYNYGVPGAPVGKELQATRTLQYSGIGWFPYTLTLAATFSYDNEGRMTGETYPTDNSGTTASLSYTFDGMGRLNTMTDNIASQTLIAGASYGPANEITSITGATGGWGGESRSYNSLKQLTQITGPYSSGLSISYHYPSTGNNGKIDYQHDNVSGEQVNYTYDALNRLATAATSDTSEWGQAFTYDGFGNLTGVSVTQGSAPTLSTTYDANNHAGGEDYNGNPGSIYLPADSASYAATYDVENRLVATGGATIFYGYAPGNKRVWKGTWTGGAGSWTRGTDEITFWSVRGQKLAAYALTTISGTSSMPQFYATQTVANYYFGGKLIKNGSGWVYSDRLGSNGKFYPYGIERPSATTNGTEKFTGYFRDAETGNDYADQRYMSPGTGRFITPDRMTGTPNDPGSWNKYAYTGGDPINRIDTHGSEYCDPESPQDCYCQIYGTPGGVNGYDPNCDPNYCPSGVCGGGAPGSPGQSGPSCQQQVVEDVIIDRAWQIGILGSILRSDFSISTDQSTVAGSGATETELVLTANSKAGMDALESFLQNSGLFSSWPSNPLVGSPGGPDHPGYTENYRQNVLFNSMQIETNPVGTAEGALGQISIDIDPFNPAVWFPLGLILHGGFQVAPNKINGTDTNYAALAQKWGFDVPKCQ